MIDIKLGTWLLLFAVVGATMLVETSRLPGFIGMASSGWLIMFFEVCPF